MGIDFQNLLTNDIITFAKIAGLIFSLVSFLFACVLIRQVFRMNDLIKTRISKILGLIGIVYLIILVIVPIIIFIL